MRHRVLLVSLLHSLASAAAGCADDEEGPPSSRICREQEPGAGQKLHVSEAIPLPGCQYKAPIGDARTVCVCYAGALRLTLHH